MTVIPNAETESLRPFLISTVEPGSTVVTDGWTAYRSACKGWFVHERHPVAGSGHQAHELLPAVHRVASLLKRWLMGTHQGTVRPEHIQPYLDEFCFRFNRRGSKARGMLFYRLLPARRGSRPADVSGAGRQPQAEAGQAARRTRAASPARHARRAGAGQPMAGRCPRPHDDLAKRA